MRRLLRTTIGPCNLVTVAPALSFEQGLAVVRGDTLPTPLPSCLVHDPRMSAYVAAGHHYPTLRAWAAAHGVAERSAPTSLPGGRIIDWRCPRDVQREALQRWQGNGCRGTIVLPTGAGKTFVAMLAIDAMATATCIIVPTRALVTQWFTQLADAFGADRVGAWYGDEKQVRDITVTTYHSAFALLEREGARFGLLICDEVHRLTDTGAGDAGSWHDALTIAPSAHRLGLTATYPDGRDTHLVRLVGPVVYRRLIGEMTDAELARFALERRYVELTRAERARYDACTTRFEAYAEESGWRASALPSDAWKRFVASTRRDPKARRAFRDFLERERIVRMAAAKFDETLRLLQLFPAEQSVIFCGGVDMALEVSRRFAIPLITASTPASERHAILAGMRDGTVRAIATVQVLDEGWDVPNAKLGIVLGDSSRGGVRQHTQRLGRLLRRQGDQMATLFEVVAAGTWEFFAAQKRSAGVRRVAEAQLGFGL